MRAVFPVRPSQFVRPQRLLLAVVLVWTGLVANGQEAFLPAGVGVTNIAELRRLSARELNARCAIRLEGNVWWANPAQRKLVLHDASGTAELEMDLPTPPVQSGQRVRLEGCGNISRRGADYRISLKEPSGAGAQPVAAGAPPLRLEVIGRGAVPDLRWIAIGQALVPGEEDPWAEVEGEVTLVSEQPDGLHLELSAMGGHLRVEVGDVSGLSSASLLNRRIRAIGFCRSAFTTTGQKVPGVLLVPSRKEIEFIETPPGPSLVSGTNEGILPTLTTAAAVNLMKREEAGRGYPVQIQGVVVCIVSNRPAFIVQDATRAVYVVVDSAIISELPQIGTYLEVEGKSDKGSFAPIVRARSVNILGLGSLPDPIHPTWDQLMNGSLDDQWVELKGVVVSLSARPLGWTSVRLRTQGGTLPVEFRVPGMTTEMLQRYVNAIVRLRGCLFVSWDLETGQVRPGVVRMIVNDLTEDQPAPADLFSTPGKTAADLMLFDPQANAFQRVKLSGQVIHAQGTEGFMMDGTNGVRFLARQAPGLQAGDLVEVVGFPELNGAAPILCEAEVRKTGRAALLPAKKLAPDDLTRADNDSTRVCVEAWLAGVRKTETNQVLEMQVGPWRFSALLNAPVESLPLLRRGSQLALTGVYAATGGSRTADGGVTSFNLLLNAPSDIRVLATPPWWTLQRLLVAVGVLTCGLAVMALWITQLRRQVEKRTAELEIQIQSRQRIEQQRTLEQERARIAHDLHDELGSGITEIGMLAARARSAATSDDRRNTYLGQVGDKAREMVTALDEIVWAMNPAHDSLTALIGYFSLYADRFLGLANITWRLEGPPATADLALNSRRRHQLFLVFKEALTNVVRHSGATDVRLSIRTEPGALRVVVADNGRGLPANLRPEGMDGLNSMRHRIEKLGGRFAIAGTEPRGVTVSFQIPLA
ncbi:MAG TPA: ATP-binding protein [Candidatus Acidoferrum sp.]|nr:ATP-binding protein [Candidatus Acidoferrum sp.]